jgi:hypothetical protein
MMFKSITQLSSPLDWSALNPQPLPPKATDSSRTRALYDDFCGTKPKPGPWPGPWPGAQLNSKMFQQDWKYIGGQASFAR